MLQGFLICYILCNNKNIGDKYMIPWHIDSKESIQFHYLLRLQADRQRVSRNRPLKTIASVQTYVVEDKIETMVYQQLSNIGNGGVKEVLVTRPPTVMFLLCIASCALATMSISFYFKLTSEGVSNRSNIKVSWKQV